jgi:hypothetical protein
MLFINLILDHKSLLGRIAIAQAKRSVLNAENCYSENEKDTNSINVDEIFITNSISSNKRKTANVLENKPAKKMVFLKIFYILFFN